METTKFYREIEYVIWGMWRLYYDFGGFHSLSTYGAFYPLVWDMLSSTIFTIPSWALVRQWRYLLQAIWIPRQMHGPASVRRCSLSRRAQSTYWSVGNEGIYSPSNPCVLLFPVLTPCKIKTSSLEISDSRIRV